MSALRITVLLTLGSMLLGCPPARENIGDGTGGGESMQTALLALDPYTGSQYALAYVYMVDADHTCAQIIQNYGLAWWNLPNGTPWVTATAYRGQFIEWESTFRSQYLWNQEGIWDYTVADFFSGTHGVGGYETGDDDDVVPPPEPQRDQEGTLGNDAAGAEDTLTFTSWSEDRIQGSIRSAAGDFWFDAEYCGYMNGGVIGGGEDVGDTPTDPAGN